MVLENLPLVVKDLKNIELRTNIAQACVHAGLAFSNTKTAIAHNLSYPITLKYGIQHGIACSFTLPMITKSMVGIDSVAEERLKLIFNDNLENAANHLSEFMRSLEVPLNLNEIKVPVKDWNNIVDDAFLGDILDTNLKGAFWGSKAAAKHLKKGGSIINISSLAGKRGSSNNSAYVASKFGMNGLTQSLAKELGPKGIRVNAVCPVLIATKGLLQALKTKHAPGNKNPKEFISNFTTNNSALNRMPKSDEVGDLCVFLASNNASAITGQCINIDCGVLPQ